MTSPRPPRPELAGTFAHPGVALAYRHRPQYPDEVFTILDGLVTGAFGTGEPAPPGADSQTAFLHLTGRHPDRRPAAS